MKPKLLLRIAAALIIIHGVMHTIGHSGWKNTTNPLQKQIVSQMTGHKFPFMGTSRSVGNYYDGYGYACSIALLLIGALLLITASDLLSNVAFAKKIIITLGIGLYYGREMNGYTFSL
jgi:hypothetical protein